MSNNLELGDLKITIKTLGDEPISAKFEMPNGSVVTRNFPATGELNMKLGLGLALSTLMASGEEIAPPYVEPEEEPDSPPAGDPTPPNDTPTDPDTDEPEPGVDPDFVHATRIEITDQKQTVIRTDADPGTWGNAYVATELNGFDYWELHVAQSTPNDATLAVGATNELLPLNGIPGDLADTVAYWSNGDVRQNGVATDGFATFGRGDKISIARDRDTGRVWFAKNGSWLGSTPAVSGSGHQGTLTGEDPYYPFIALYSESSRASFKFITSKFTYSVPTGFYPIGKSPPVITSANAGNCAENAQLSHALTANEAVTWSIVGGADQGDFGISTAELQWNADGTQNFEAPNDSDTNNIYVVNVRATSVASGLTSDQTITITVTDVVDSDPNFASVVMLIGFDGTDAATAADDESNSNHTLTFAGNAQLDTAQKQFGSASLLLDGTGDFVSAPDNADWNLGSGHFTIECWVRPNSVTGNQFLIAQWGGVATLAWALWMSGTALNWSVSTDGSNNLADLSGGIMTTGAWQALAIDYDGTTYRLYRGGTMVDSSTTARTIFNATATLNIGSNSLGSTFFYSGAIDEVRITKGVARYASDDGYTPAVAAFFRS